MPRFDGLIDQDRPLRILAGILAKGNIPHAFLLTGIDGIGKRTAAIRFAMALNCHASQSPAMIEAAGAASGPPGAAIPCGQCSACVKILAGSHPDVMVVEPSGDVIKIGQIRELIRRLAFTPHETKAARVVVISDAQTMNVEASNALLKALEEPPSQTFIFLTAGQTADLLPTVVSRCQHLRFNPVSAEKIAQHLIQNRGLDAAAAGAAAVMADGSFAAALDLSSRPSTLAEMASRRRWLAAEINRLPTCPIPMVMMFAQKLAADKQSLLLSLDLIGRFLRDALVALYCPERLTNTDLREAITAIARDNAPPVLLLKMTAVADAEQAVRQHANQRLTTEVLAMRLAGLAA